MVRELPAAYREAVVGSSAEEVSELVADVQALVERGAPASTISQKMVEAGWDDAFSAWYSAAVVDAGAAFAPSIGPSATPGSNPTPATDRGYEALIKKKKGLQTSALLKFVASVAIFLLYGMIPWHKGSAAPIGETALGLALVVAILLCYVSSLADYAQSKGYSRATCIIGVIPLLGLIFILGMPDHNDLEPPGATD